MWVKESTYTQSRHLEVVGWLVLCLASFTPWESSRYSFNRRLSGPQDQSGHEGAKKNLHPSDTQDRTRTIQPVVKRHASWATWPTCLLWLFYSLWNPFPNCTGIRHRSSGKLYSKFASCFRTQLSAFHLRIVNIHMFMQWEFLSRHVTNRNNHNNYTYSTKV